MAGYILAKNIFFAKHFWLFEDIKNREEKINYLNKKGVKGNGNGKISWLGRANGQCSRGKSFFCGKAYV
jgi:hypothetical protein